MDRMKFLSSCSLSSSGRDKPFKKYIISIHVYNLVTWNIGKFKNKKNEIIGGKWAFQAGTVRCKGSEWEIAFQVTVRDEVAGKSIQYLVDHGKEMGFIPGEISHTKILGNRISLCDSHFWKMALAPRWERCEEWESKMSSQKPGHSNYLRVFLR